MAKRKIINDPKKFPQDFWNYLVNPIVGYHINTNPLQRRGTFKNVSE